MDKFKIGLLVLGFGYLAYLFCPVSNQAGRYQYSEKIDERGWRMVFDTSTGILYRYSNIGGGKKWNIIKEIEDDISDRKEIIKNRNAAARMEEEETK